MIRVNLLKNKGVVSAPAAASPSPKSINLDAGFKTTGGGFSSEQVSTALKVLVMLSGVSILYGYQMYLDKMSKQRIVSVQMEKERLLELRTEKEERANTLPQLEEKHTFFKEKIDEFNAVTRFRLAELHSLDAIQSSITREAWIKSIVYEQGKLNILGSSYTGLGFDEFNSNLERQEIFKAVRFNKVAEGETGSSQGSSILDFQLTAEVDEGFYSGR